MIRVWTRCPVNTKYDNNRKIETLLNNASLKNICHKFQIFSSNACITSSQLKKYIIIKIENRTHTHTQCVYIYDVTKFMHAWDLMQISLWTYSTIETFFLVYRVLRSLYELCQNAEIFISSRLKNFLKFGSWKWR